MRLLLSSYVKDIKNILWAGMSAENGIIIFTAKINTVYDGEFEYNEYKIGQYDLQEGCGYIVTSKGLKEYTSLKCLIKAISKFAPVMDDGYVMRKSIEYKKNFKPEVSEPVENAEIVEIKEELDSNQKMESVTTHEAAPTKNDKLIQGLKNSIAQVKEELNNIINTGDQINGAILNHPDTNKSPDKYSYEYKKLHDTLDYIDSIEDQLRDRLKLLGGKLYTLLNTQLIESYGDCKYKVVLSNQTIFTNDYSEYIKKYESIQVRQLIYIKDDVNALEVNVYYRYTETYSSGDVVFIHIHTYDNNKLIYEAQYRNDSLFFESNIRKDLTCNYYGITGIKEVSYFSPSIPLQFIQVHPDGSIHSYYSRGNTFVKGITETAQDKLKRFKEKYKHDLQVMEYLNLIHN